MVKAKRFWKTVESRAVEGGFEITLDGRPVRTPAKVALVVPSQAFADEVVAEWSAVEEEIETDAMPATRMANSAIDKLVPQFDLVVDMLAEYAGTDLLCYRATSPSELVERQAQAWDPVIEWFQESYGPKLVVTQGVLPVEQGEDVIPTARRLIGEHGPFELAALHDLIVISGSAILGLGVSSNQIESRDAFDLSRIDEYWQIEQWGADDEADKVADQKWKDFNFAANMLRKIRDV